MPVHLAMATATWLGSRGALAPSNGAWPGSSPALRSLREELARVEPRPLAAAIDRAVQDRLNRFLQGIQSYRRHAYRRQAEPVPELWQEGATRLLDYRSSAARDRAPIVLVVPSLINRAYILDLMAERSLLRHLAGRGLRPLLVDWGRPGESERGFDLTAYIAGRLERALDAVLALAGGPVIVLGYCMGGLLALALATRRARDLAGLACLATPWDFHAEQPAQARLVGAIGAALEPLLGALGELPLDAMQTLFAGLDPLQVARKFLGFAGLDPESPRARLFVAVEDWLNDGVPLAAPVARECLTGWYGANTPAAGAWRVADRPVRPQSLDLPALVVVPDQDRIVPPASALALAAALPRATMLRPAAGHIGMIVGGTAVERLYRPLGDWLLRPA